MSELPRQFTTAEDVLAVLDNTSQRIAYTELIDSLKKNGRPTAGVGVVVDRLASAGTLLKTDPNGDPWLDQYGMEPDEPGFQDGPLYLEKTG